MKVQVSTTHDLIVAPDDMHPDSPGFHIKVDDDGTVRLSLPGVVSSASPTVVSSMWLEKDELLVLRALITKAIALLP